MDTADTTALTGLREALSGRVVTRADADWDPARQAFNLAVDQQPVAVAFPGDEADVVAAVAFARDHGLRIAPQRTGHNAGPLGRLDDTVLLRTDAMQGVNIDAQAGRARVRAGATWGDVVPEASGLGFAALHGSTPDVGIVGYCLGGGMGWYARKWGLGANSVTAVELVTADGRLLRADADHEVDLFWALRGGGGSFGAVTALEFALYPVDEAYAGALFFPWQRAAQVLHTWHELLPSLPDEMTSCGRILQFPALPEVPDALRGRPFVIVEAVFVGDEAEGASLLRPLRDLGPELDAFAMAPPAAITQLHMDPPHPVPADSAHQLLGDLPASAIDEFVAVTGPGSGSPLVSAELRHTGGALARSEPHHGALSTLPGSLSMFAVGMPADAATGAAISAQLAQVTGALAPYEVGHALNFVEAPYPTVEAYPPESFRRLQAVKASYDPADVFRANHPVPPGDQALM